MKTKTRSKEKSAIKGRHTGNDKSKKNLENGKAARIESELLSSDKKQQRFQGNPGE